MIITQGIVAGEVPVFGNLKIVRTGRITERLYALFFWQGQKTDPVVFDA
jgi:hypothetical protein